MVFCCGFNLKPLSIYCERPDETSGNSPQLIHKTALINFLLLTGSDVGGCHLQTDYLLLISIECNPLE